MQAHKSVFVRTLGLAHLPLSEPRCSQNSAFEFRSDLTNQATMRSWSAPSRTGIDGGVDRNLRLVLVAFQMGDTEIRCRDHFAISLRSERRRGGIAAPDSGVLLIDHHVKRGRRRRAEIGDPMAIRPAPNASGKLSMNHTFSGS